MSHTICHSHTRCTVYTANTHHEMKDRWGCPYKNITSLSMNLQGEMS